MPITTDNAQQKMWKQSGNIARAKNVRPVGSDDGIMQYRDPTGNYTGTPTKSSIDAGGTSNQINTEYFLKKALIDEAKEMIWGKFSDTDTMPKNYGKKLIGYHYLPILDDRNINDMGLWVDGSKREVGNLYGSSRDIGKINDRIPLGNEVGGRFNRVGMSRKTYEGEIYKVQFFTEWTKDSMDFDSDDQLFSHLSREIMRAAYKLKEDLLQMDIIHGAGIRGYGGVATSIETMTGELGDFTDSIVRYADLKRLGVIMDKMDCPKKTKIINGSTMQDTRVIPASRFMIIGPDVVPILEQMTDQFGNPAFIPVEHYAYSGTTGNSLSFETEVGTCGGFRFIQHMEMMYYAGAGAVATDNPERYMAEITYKGLGEPDGGDAPRMRYNVYPMVAICDGSFSDVGFGTTYKKKKFKIKYSFPNDDISYSALNPYGTNGFMSIQFYAGTLIKRPERLAVFYTLSKSY